MLNFGFGKRKRLQHLLEKRVVRGLGKTGAPRASSSLTAPVFPTCHYAAQRQQALRWGKAPRTLAGWFKILTHTKMFAHIIELPPLRSGLPSGSAAHQASALPAHFSLRCLVGKGRRAALVLPLTVTTQHSLEQNQGGEREGFLAYANTRHIQIQIKLQQIESAALEIKMVMSFNSSL